MALGCVPFLYLAQDMNAMASTPISAPSYQQVPRSHAGENWYETFQLPSNFSARTMVALQSGNKMDITSAVRNEITAAVATLMMVHTTYPTPAQYTHVCEMLVKKHPILADTYGCGFVSALHVLVTKIKYVSHGVHWWLYSFTFMYF